MEDNKRRSLNRYQVVERQAERVLDASSQIPDGIGVSSSGDSGSIGGGVDEESGTIFIEAPSNLRVVEQIVNVQPGGYTTVDVIIEFDGVNNATNYNYRLAKVDEAETVI